MFGLCTRRYLFLEEALTLLLMLAVRVKARSVSGTSTTTCGLCTKPRPLWTQTCRRRSRTSRVPLSSRLTPYKRHRMERMKSCTAGKGLAREDWVSRQADGGSQGGVCKTSAPSVGLGEHCNDGEAPEAEHTQGQLCPSGGRQVGRGCMLRQQVTG